MTEQRLRLWMDVMRHLDPVMANHERWFDAWEAGGVDGLVIGPMTFEDKSFTFDPKPEVYRRFGTEPPPSANTGSLWWKPPAASPTTGVPAGVDAKRALLSRTLQAAKDRGWSVWLFCPHYGAGPGGGPMLVDDRTRVAAAARLVDCLEQYPMADGAVLDGPEWGYEIAPFHQNRRSYIFDDLPPAAAEAATRLGYNYERLIGAKDRLYARLHGLSDRDVRLWGSGKGGFLGAFGLLGNDPALAEWLAFRLDTVTETYGRLRELVQTHARRPIRLAAGPRSAAWSSLCGYDYGSLTDALDVMLCKHYFWHRGFDGMYGTAARYVQALTEWNADLSEWGALRVVEALFGIELPGITGLRDFDRGFPQEFFDTVVVRETERAIAAMRDPERVCPWVDAGRKPHDGEPFTPHDLDRTLEAASRAGLRRFLYHHHGNLTPGEWAVISARCGQPWEATTSPRPQRDVREPVPDMPGYYPPDLPIL
ncbi:MAG: hypothetical protein HY332_23500 [Chloroflexi bacterium]|nr:hypothetical protein [Chloroflexota bacterium]